MNIRRALLAAALLGPPSPALFAADTRFAGYDFQAQVLRPGGQRYREFPENGRPHLKVRPNEEYSIVVRNPLPVRAAVAVSVDGLNSIDGHRTSPRGARKWIVEPYGSLTIQGWQTGGDASRKFVFTDQGGSYAQWREGADGRPYTRNLGVIGVAWFWNRAELDAALHPPQPFDDAAAGAAVRSEAPSRKAAPAPAAALAGAERAGTGMGRRLYNPVTEVEFNADAGMFAARDVLAIAYDFAKEPPQPLPFVSEEDEGRRFAPEMAN